MYRAITELSNPDKVLIRELLTVPHYRRAVDHSPLDPARKKTKEKESEVRREAKARTRRETKTKEAERDF